MLDIMPLGSGSRGNAWVVRNETTQIMIDAGLSCRQLTLRMNAAGIEPEATSALFISHEHHDHISGLKLFARRFGPDIHIAEKTLEKKDLRSGLHRTRIIQPGMTVCVGALEISAIPVPHDAAEPMAFSISEPSGDRITIATDLGHVTGLVRQYLSESSLIVIEANHDPEMLINGSYPWNLKQRIRGRFGHLSNIDAGEALRQSAHRGLKGVYLAHLSEENNTPEHAFGTVAEILGDLRERDFPLLLARQRHPGSFLLESGSRAKAG